MDMSDFPSTPQAQRNQLFYARCPVPSPLSLAVQLGWIDDAIHQLAGIDIQMLFEGTNPTDLPVHTHASLSSVFRQGGCAPAIWNYSQHHNTRVIGLTLTNEYQALIALPQSGIHSIHHLRGRRIGLPKHDVILDHARAAALRGFSIILESVGMSLNDVQIIDLPDHAIPALVRDGHVVSTGTGRRGRYCYSSEIHALSQQLVDAVYVKDMRGAQACHLLGAQVFASINQHPDPHIRQISTIPRPLTVSTWLYKNHPDLVDCLLEQSFIAGEWAAQHPTETLGLLIREMGWAENWIRYAYSNHIHCNLHLGLTKADIKHLADYKDFLLVHQFIQQNFPIDQWIENAPMERLQAKLNTNNQYKQALLRRAFWDNTTISPIH